MGNKFQQQIRVVSRDKIRSSTSVVEAAFFNEDGDPISVGNQADHVAAVTAPNGTDATSTQTLANALKVTVNAIRQELIDAGLMKAS